ncbi:toll/interleukin-1 receptor domain-containing protein (plasmid) [Clostridium perfringens]|uniref:toll/interleukin-1 receptor domain-containing protein n=1 Tax=Clostridium perfringens TaxID=1502 RepID=UPI0023417491|nr:toll/interleukin-1 receptor domain-containing protein [Clostridium perfringens]MDC4252317.1 toll/interleukin-1 receptor domain-containing protein [Clostridium perfringens]
MHNRENDNTYLFDLSYANRTQENKFISDVLTTFDENIIMGTGIIVNNNPYSLEFYFYVNFNSSDTNIFDNWLKSNYPEYIHKIKYNYFMIDVFVSLQQCGYNVYTGDFDPYNLITSEPNYLFQFPDKKTMSIKFKGGLKQNNSQAFITHSSLDKHIVDDIFNILQRKDINIFYDKHGIQAGENIRDIINSNLNKSNTCILCVSKNLDYKKSEWIKTEIEYFKNKNIRIIPINIDLSDSEFKEKIGDWRYLNYSDKNYINELIKILKVD